MTIDKAVLLEKVRETLVAALETMAQAANTAREAATHEEAKPENDKDTRGLEAGYLAAGQSARAIELRRALSTLKDFVARPFAPDERVAAGALVDVVDEKSGAVQRLFIAPEGGGLKVAMGGKEVQVVTPRSPLGDAIVGKKVGDLVEMHAGGRLRELSIASVE